MPNDACGAGTPAGVFGAELRFYRTRAGLSQKDLAAVIADLDGKPPVAYLETAAEGQGR